MLTQEDIKILDEMFSTKFDQLDKKIDSVKDELTGKIDSVKDELTGKIDTVKDELDDKIEKSKEETIHQMLMLYEVKIKPSIDLLAEGHQSILERTVRREEYEMSKEEFDIRLSALELAMKKTTREIETLKKAM